MRVGPLGKKYVRAVGVPGMVRSSHNIAVPPPTWPDWDDEAAASEWPAATRYAIAVAIACSAAILSRLIDDINPHIDTGIFILGMAVAAWLCGPGPAIVATLISVLAYGRFLADPSQLWLPRQPEQNVSMFVMIATGAFLAWFSSRFNLTWISGDSQAGRSDGLRINYQSLVEGVKECAILLIDKQGLVASWTETACRMTGYSRHQMIGRPLSLLAVDSATSISAFNRVLETASHGGKGSLQTRFLRKDGTEFWADIVVGVVRDGENFSGFSVLLRDVTARKEAEDLLEQRSWQLSEASRLKDEFLATVSHELRTPLNSILGWTQLFRAGKLDDAGRSHALETVEQCAKTQARLIEDLLDMSRIITGKMRLDVRSVQMADVIKAAVETVRPAADAKNISIELNLDSIGSPVFGDPNRLQQIVWNLLSNAIKFTPQGGNVTVWLGREGSSVRLVVQDSGCGISEEFLPYVFDAFRQADSSSTRAHKGLGLGLTIVRRLIEMHGGTIKAESTGDGTGATFEIMLPVGTAPKSSPVISQIDSQVNRMTGRVPTPVPPDARDVRVVVVDDDPQARELISTVLSHSGIQVDAVASAAEALSAVERLAPDVVVSDIEMPVEDGYMFIQELRALDAEHGGKTPAVALTAYARAEDRSRSLAAGFQLHLAKPIEADELVHAVIALATQRRKGNSHAQAARS